MEDKRYAVLIDSDNVSAKYILAILDEMTKYGTITYKRIYGDWTKNQASKWREELLANSITPIQQFYNTAGKNATDSALIIDAMDILYSGRVDGFCLVSSDGDFTKLASRLRESGMDVIGMGEIVEIITENENNGKKTGLGELGNSLLKKYSDFDVRNYGYSSLSKFIEEMEDTFTLYKKETTILVALRDDSLKREQLEAYILECVQRSNGEGVDLAAMGQKIHKKYPDFKVKEFGYSKFVSHIPGLELVTENENVKRLRKKEAEGKKTVVEQLKKTSYSRKRKLGR